MTSVTEAVVSHWLLQALEWSLDPGWTVSVPHSVQRPGNVREWYRYHRQWVTDRLMSSAQVSHAARKLPDGTVVEVRSTYNDQDQLTWRRDPVGRETTHTYAENGIDLVDVRNTTGGRNDLLGV